MQSIQDITSGELRPFLPDTKGEDYYSPLFRGLAVVKEKFQPRYSIEFPAPLLSAKVKYYKRLIDNNITAELNNLFGLLENESEDLILFHRKKLFEKIKSALEDTQRFIEHNQYDINVITSQFAVFSKNPQHNECTYIFNYLSTALIRCYMEFQAHFIQFIEEDKQISIADFYTQILKKQVPQNTFIKENQIIAIKATTEEVQPETSEINVAVQLAEDNYSRFMQEVQPYQFTELPKYKALSSQNQIRLINDIVGKSVPYAIAMLNFLEYPERLKAVYSMNKEKQYSHIAKSLNAVPRSVKGNFLVLNPKSNEDRLKYTADQNEQTVKDFYYSLTNKTQ